MMAYATTVVATVRAVRIAGRALLMRTTTEYAIIAKWAIKKAMLITDLRDKLTLSCDLLPT